MSPDVGVGDVRLLHKALWTEMLLLESTLETALRVAGSLTVTLHWKAIALQICFQSAVSFW